MYTSHTIYSSNDTHQGCVHFHTRTRANDIRIATTYKNRKAFMLPTIPDDEYETNAVYVEDVNYLTNVLQQLLWHQRLFHIHNSHKAQKYANVIPIMMTPNKLDKCDICMTCKMKKSAQGKGKARADAIKVGQGISIDFGFMVQNQRTKTEWKHSHH
eukprot:15365642-Ditylum_brightwellii.AAC.1